MDEGIVEPEYEYEAPRFFDFSNVDAQQDDEQPDAWFDRKARIEEGTALFDEPLTETEESDDKVADEQCVATSPSATKVQDKSIEKTSSSKIENAIVEEQTDNSKVPEGNEDISRALSSDNNACKSESEVEFSNDSLNERSDTAKEKETSLTQGSEEMSSNADVPSENSDAGKEATQKSKQCKIVPSLEDWGKRKSNTSQAVNKASTSNDMENDQSSVVTRAQKRNRSLDVVSAIPKKKQKEMSSQKLDRQRQKRPRSFSGSHEKKTLTLAVTPQCLKRQRTTRPTIVKLKTREEMELECIAKLRKKTHHHIKVNEASMKKAISSTSYHHVRTMADPTKPQEFHFATDKRVKPHPMTTRADDAEKVFLNSLRQHPPSPRWKNRNITIPKPFNLSGGQAKRKLAALDGDEKAADSYESMAYQVYKFQTTTPPRFRTRKHGDEGKLPEKKSSGVKMTRPVPPTLTTSKRARPVGEDVLSKEQQEEKEVEAMKSYQFKAKPFDRRIVECEGLYGVKIHKDQKQTTQIEPFSFESDERLEVRKEKKAPSDEQEEEPAPFKALPQPKFDKVFRPQLKHARTEPKPFSFEEKDKERWQKKEGKIQEVYKVEEKLREFKAQPLPPDSPDTLPEVASKSGTSFKPFALNTENRGAIKAEKWIQKVQMELQEERKKVEFHAKPSKVVLEAPFVPQKSQRALTDISEFALNTNRRAEHREELEMFKKEREMVDEELRKEEEEKRLQEENEALAKLRKDLVHKPQPIHKYKTVVVKPSAVELTTPQSPAWSDIKQRRLGNIR